jgi:hypothetical protein
MTKPVFLTVAIAFSLVSATMSVLVPSTHAREKKPKEFVPPAVFQAAGPTVQSIQGTVDAYRAALGDPNNGNTA